MVERMRELGAEMPDQKTTRGEASAEGVEIKFFPRASVGLVPYVELPLVEHAGFFWGRLPLWQVIQGPTANAELSLESVGMHLESYGYVHTQLKQSQIPLR
jgi:hypothetical protein